MAFAAEITAALRGDAPLPAGALATLLDALCMQPPSGAWHPTGFVVLRVLDDEEGALRLHLWPQGERCYGTPCWPVHDHVWDLRSQVICGPVHSHGYAVNDDPEGEAVLYSVEYEPGRRSWMHRSERRVRVRALAPQRIEEGQRYQVEAGAFHASQVQTEAFAATLVATRRTPRARPWVVGALEGSQRVEVRRPRAEPARVAALLRQVRSQLDERSARRG